MNDKNINKYLIPLTSEHKKVISIFCKFVYMFQILNCVFKHLGFLSLF